MHPFEERPKITVKPKVTIVAPKQPAANVTLEVKAPKPTAEEQKAAEPIEPVTPVADVIAQEAAAPAPTEAPAVPMPVLAALAAAALGVAAGVGYRAGQRKAI